LGQQQTRNLLRNCKHLQEIDQGAFLENGGRQLVEKQSIKQIEDKTLKNTPDTDSFSESCDLSTQLIGGDDIPIIKGWDEIFNVLCQVHCL
jgi:hypothetical protein